MVSDIQTDVAIEDDAVTGTSKWLADGDIASYWGSGNFVAFKFEDIDERATSVRVGLEPSAGQGLVEIINDPDKNGVFKITNKNNQVFKIVITDGEHTVTQEFDLSGLNLESEPSQYVEYNLDNFNLIDDDSVTTKGFLAYPLDSIEEVIIEFEDGALDSRVDDILTIETGYSAGESEDNIHEGTRGGPTTWSRESTEQNYFVISGFNAGVTETYQYAFLGLIITLDEGETMFNIFQDLSKATLKIKYTEQ